MTPEAAAAEAKQRAFEEYVRTSYRQKSSKATRRGTPGAFGKCKNWPKEAYREQYIKQLQSKIFIQKLLTGQANADTLKTLETVSQATNK